MEQPSDIALSSGAGQHFPAESFGGPLTESFGKEVEPLRPRVKVHSFPYYDVGKIGGSLCCNTCPIYREG